MALNRSSEPSSVGIVGLIVAGSAARPAAEHRAEERTANLLVLDLAALDPFLENVSEPEKIRTEIAKHVFMPEPRHDDAPGFSFGRRCMTLAELVDFVNVMRKPPSGRRPRPNGVTGADGCDTGLPCNRCV